MFLNIGTCPLYVLYNSFCKGVAALNFDVDQYALDIPFFFKFSAEQRADYKSVGDVTNIVYRKCYEAFNNKMGHTSKSCSSIDWTTWKLERTF